MTAPDKVFVVKADPATGGVIAKMDKPANCDSVEYIRVDLFRAAVDAALEVARG
jgi:hypothetical protein